MMVEKLFASSMLMNQLRPFKGANSFVSYCNRGSESEKIINTKDIICDLFRRDKV